MTTANHPSHMGVRWHPNHEWLWIGLSAIVIALVAVAFIWIANQPANTVAPVLESRSGFEYDHEVTTGQIVSPGVTTEYFGNSGELYPALSVLPSATGFAYDHEVTTGQIVSPGVTTEYYGNSGELFADN